MPWEGLNRRKFPRAQFPCLIKLSLEDGSSETLLTHTENISSGGICVIIKRGLGIFSLLSIEIDLMDGGDPIRCKGKIIWTVRRKATEELKPSFYDIGIEYCDLDGHDEQRIARVIQQLLKDTRAVRV